MGSHWLALNPCRSKTARLFTQHRFGISKKWCSEQIEVMGIKHVQLIVLVVILVTECMSLPFPQNQNEDYYYDDYNTDEDSGPVLPDISGLITIFGDGLRNLLSPKNIQRRIEDTANIVEDGIQVVNQAPRIIEAGQQGIRNIVENENIQRVSGQVVETAGNVAATVMREGPRLANSGTKLVRSLMKATNDTAPMVISGLQEFAELAPVFMSFLRSYAEVNAEQTREVLKTFNTSFQCEYHCRDLFGTAKEKCEKMHCKKKEESV